ncbi:MAG: hypothetical protein U1F29_17545 [Planctomycetota bacterium]
MRVFAVLDLAWIVTGWIEPWSWILVPLALLTPCWAVANVLVVRDHERTTWSAEEHRASTALG